MQQKAVFLTRRFKWGGKEFGSTGIFWEKSPKVSCLKAGLDFHYIKRVLVALLTERNNRSFQGMDDLYKITNASFPHNPLSGKSAILPVACLHWF